MRKIAIVGAGQAGLLAAHGLLQKGYDVTLFSDRTPEDFLTTARPTGTAARFHMALEYERELGLEHWGDVAPRGEGVHLTFCQKPGNQFLTLIGRLDHYSLAIDVRLQSATWMRDFSDRGGRIEIETVTVDKLEEIATEHDLTVVAAGRADITRLFPRDEARSTYAAPQRYLSMVNVHGLPMMFDTMPHFRPIKFNFFASEGEAFFVPWYSKDGHQAWSLVFEGKPGRRLDRFRDAKSAQDVLARALEVTAETIPWDYEWMKGAQICDENAWLVGHFVPEVRAAAGRLPSGRHVMSLGDTAHAQDPIAGQGANNGNKMARNLVECVVERADRPFDADWMRATFDRFWERHRYIDMLTGTLLEPLTTAGKILLISQYGSDGRPGDPTPQQKIANAFINNFSDPRDMTEAFHKVPLAKRVVREAFGAWLLPTLRGALGVLRGQLRQKLGRPAGHPGL